jgi:hypothetical protein
MVRMCSPSHGVSALECGSSRHRVLLSCRDAVHSGLRRASVCRPALPRPAGRTDSLVRAGYAWHREPLVVRGHERSRPASRIAGQQASTPKTVASVAGRGRVRIPSPDHGGADPAFAKGGLESCCLVAAFWQWSGFRPRTRVRWKSRPQLAQVRTSTSGCAGRHGRPTRRRCSMPPPSSAVSQSTSGPQGGRSGAVSVPGSWGTTLTYAVPCSRAVFPGQRVDSGVRARHLERLFRGCPWVRTPQPPPPERLRAGVSRVA